jgi:hypothetical protein
MENAKSRRASDREVYEQIDRIFDEAEMKAVKILIKNDFHPAALISPSFRWLESLVHTCMGMILEMSKSGNADIVQEEIVHEELGNQDVENEEKAQSYIG